LIELCRHNIEHNKLGGSAEAIAADVTTFSQSGFDHVIMNPPFHEEARHSVSENAIKRTANAEKTGDLPLWIESAAKALNASGVLTLIHRADRQDDIMQTATQHFGSIDILPIISRENAAPKRILMRMSKGQGSTVNTYKSFILYGPNNRYCEAAEEVIRHGKALEFIVT
jgi:tRNA1(Val) A37 N6-methylase TrmN6